MDEFVEKMAALRDAIKTKRPLVHHLTNYVTAGYCADMALTIGASPVMADELSEMADMTTKADALVINLGTINQTKFGSMLKAVEVANCEHIPVVLDPVGVMATRYRLQAANLLLESGVNIIRGNLSECSSLLTNQANGRGVDSTVEAAQQQGEIAKQVAQQYNCVCAITGVTDAISDGKTIILAHNGDAMLSNITGSGCMTTTLIGAAMGTTDNYLAAAVFGITAMNIAGERAAKSCKGPGSFRMQLVDEIYQLTAYDIATYFKGEKL